MIPFHCVPSLPLVSPSLTSPSSSTHYLQVSIHHSSPSLTLHPPPPTIFKSPSLTPFHPPPPTIFKFPSLTLLHLPSSSLPPLLLYPASSIFPSLIPPFKPHPNLLLPFLLCFVLSTPVPLVSGAQFLLENNNNNNDGLGSSFFKSYWMCMWLGLQHGLALWSHLVHLHKNSPAHSPSPLFTSSHPQ